MGCVFQKHSLVYAINSNSQPTVSDVMQQTTTSSSMSSMDVKPIASHIPTSESERMTP